MRAALPATYRALQLSSPGPTSHFNLVSLPTRQPSTDEVLVKVQSCAVAFRDVLDRQGAFKFIRRPTVLGHEFAGTVVSVGANISRWSVGDRVVSLHWDQAEAWPSPLTNQGAVPSMFGLMRDGGYADFVYSPAGALAKAATDMHSPAASAVMSTFGTVWQGAVERAGMRAGHHVLVTGASGGVGSAAVQLAKAMGCRVTAVTTSQSKIEALTAFGAANCLVAREDGSFKQGSHDLADIVIETVGGPCFPSSLRSTKPGGKLVLVGNVTNAVSQLPLGYVILNSISIVGSDSIAIDAFENRLLPFLRENKLAPHIAAEMPLEDAGKAHQLLESRAVTGRLVLRIDHE